MSNSIKLLDCTLRDGGYINDWEFGHDNLISIYERLAKAGVDIVEVGFIDDRRPYDYNRSIYPNTAAIAKTLNKAVLRPEMVVGMIDYGTCNLDYIEPCEESFLDGIRVIFKKSRMKEAMEYCRALKDKGYAVFSQLVSITSYSDDELLELIKLVNDVKPYAVSMVDTYGLLDPGELLHFYEILDREVLPEIKIGFHAHNNLQLAYANSLVFVEKKTKRDIIVDGTLFGMGKSAGNAPLELLGRYLNGSGFKYDINSMLEAIEESIKEVHSVSPWGYQTKFFLSAENRCHPNYVSFFEAKGNLSKSKLNELLSKIEPKESKLLYDKVLAEKLYADYVSENVIDEKAISELCNQINKRQVLVIGPGKNIELQKKKVNSYIDNKKPFIVSINYIPKDINVDAVFITKLSRYKEMADELHENPAVIQIVTSNVEVINSDAAIMFNREPLLEKKEDILDNSFLMMLKILYRSGIRSVALAGLDGYSDKEDNYFEPTMEYGFVKSVARHLNRHIHSVLTEDYKDVEFDFVTYSHYMEEEDPESARF